MAASGFFLNKIDRQSNISFKNHKVEPRPIKTPNSSVYLVSAYTTEQFAHLIKIILKSIVV